MLVGTGRDEALARAFAALEAELSFVGTTAIEDRLQVGACPYTQAPNWAYTYTDFGRPARRQACRRRSSACARRASSFGC